MARLFWIIRFTKKKMLLQQQQNDVYKVYLLQEESCIIFY